MEWVVVCRPLLTAHVRPPALEDSFIQSARRCLTQPAKAVYPVRPLHMLIGANRRVDWQDIS